jgi:NADPH2:quinone reductase
MHKIVMTRTGGPEVLEWVEAPDPVAGPGEVVVKTHTAAVGWPEVLVRTGTYKWSPPLPLTPGNELSGHIESVGPDVETLKVGQPVYIASRELNFQGGCYTEKIKAPAEAVLPVPENVELDAIAGLGYYSLAYALMHETAHARPVKRVLVIGAAGGVGTALVQMAHYEGREVIGTVSSPEKAAHAQAMGAAHTINYRTENVMQRVLEVTNGEGVDLILDPVVGPSFADNFRMLAKWGHVVSYNAVGGMPAEGLFGVIRSFGDRAVGLHCFSMHVYEGDREGRRRIQTPALAMMAAGVRPPKGLVLPLSQAAEAHRILESGAAKGRIMMQPD